MQKKEIFKIPKLIFALFAVMVFSLFFKKESWREKFLADFSFWDSASADDPNPVTDTFAGSCVDCGSSSSAGGCCV